ncbi:MAG: hypothetical protein AAF533_13820 [Acidobacteriota bacterium]
MRPRPRHLLLLALPVLVGLIAALVLGPADVAWSLRASVLPGSDRAAWAHVPADASLQGVLSPQRMLESEQGTLLLATSIELWELGLDDLEQARRVETVVIAADDARGFWAAGRPLPLAPRLIARFGDRAKALDVATPGGRTLRAADDGRWVFAPSAAAVVVAGPSEGHELWVERAWPTVDRDPPLVLGPPEEVLLARLSDASPWLAPVARDLPAGIRNALNRLENAELRGELIDERLMLHVDALFLDEGSARTVENGIDLVNGAGRLFGGFGGLGGLLGRDVNLDWLKALPRLEVRREGRVLHLTAPMGPEQLRAMAGKRGR